MVFGSGYLANLGVIPALAGKSDLILADRLSHACTWDGTRLSGATVMRFTHNSLEHCDELLTRHRAGFERCLILTETVFSMEGDHARPIAQLGSLARPDAWLMTDDMDWGSARREEPRRADGHALSKVAAGSYGGYVCAPKGGYPRVPREQSPQPALRTTGLPPRVGRGVFGRGWRS